MNITMEESLAAAIAVSLYQYNVSAGERAAKLYAHFKGECAELDELLIMVDSKNWATEMAAPTAQVYLEHALEKYMNEARHRVQVNLGAAREIYWEGVE